jgi:hypothetical protein
MKEFLGLLYQTRQPADCFGSMGEEGECRTTVTRAAMKELSAHGQLAGIVHGR